MISTSLSLKTTTRCHSVFSFRSPLALSRQDSEVATDRFTTGSPLVMRRTSGSLPRLPTKITLLTLPAIACLHYQRATLDESRLPAPCRWPFIHPHSIVPCLFQ